MRRGVEMGRSREIKVLRNVLKAWAWDDYVMHYSVVRDFEELGMSYIIDDSWLILGFSAYSGGVVDFKIHMEDKLLDDVGALRMRLDAHVFNPEHGKFLDVERKLKERSPYR